MNKGSCTVVLTLEACVLLSCGTVYYAVQGGSNFSVTFESVDEILWCKHSNESY